MKFTTICASILYAASLSTAAAVSPSVPPLCGNAGLQWAHFDDYQETGDNSQYDPAAHKKDVPDATGVTNYIHIATIRETTLYGTPGLNLNRFAVEHRGYLFAPETGTYIFSASNIDDNFYMWLGPLAYNGWAKGTQAQDAYYTRENGNGTSIYTTSLIAGQYYPIRLVTRNAAGPSSWDYSVTAPSGRTLIGNNPNAARSTPFVVQYACDSALAPQYPPFGQEI